jgi:alpha-mannosidase
MSVIAALDGTDVAMPDLSDDWVLMLRNQFHDILPGSSIREVYEQTEPELAGIVERTETIARNALAALAEKHRGAGTQQGLVVANLSGSAKPRWQIVSPSPLPEALAPQVVGDSFVVASDQPLAPLSLSFVGGSARSAVVATSTALENDFVRATIDGAGRVVSLFDKRCGRELADRVLNRLMVYRNDLPRNFDAWDIEPGFALGGEELTTLEALDVTASGPHLGEITVTRSVGASRITQRLRLWANSPRLEFVTDIDWHDRRTYVRAEFPVTVLAGEAQFDQAIGVTSRATHDNTGWQRAQFESCAHRFVSLSETDWGAALISGSKYGFSVKGNLLSLSLIRGPMYPDMLADEGHHAFTYAILPHDGRWWSEDVQAEADLVNDPLRFVPAAADAPYEVAPVFWWGQQLRFHTLKPSEDKAGYVLRVSEAAGRRGALDVEVPSDRPASPVDGLERPLPDLDTTTIRPFQLISLRF